MKTQRNALGVKFYTNRITEIRIIIIGVPLRINHSLLYNVIRVTLFQSHTLMPCTRARVSVRGFFFNVVKDLSHV